MTIRIVRVGSPGAKKEGTRIGAVRFLPRGVPKARYAADDWFDAWFPDLAPSKELVARGRTVRSDAEWKKFASAFRAEASKGPAARALELLAALSHHSDFSVGCYCEDEARCHRSVLRALLKEKGAKVAT
jgi:uncharacterized protein YeaO (DUF488 family)